MKAFHSVLLSLILSAGFITSSFAGKKSALEPGIYARFETTKGNILVKLEHEKAPMTVANFVGLAEGKFTVNGKEFTKPFYDGLKFHRVIPNFMIQGGDPAGNGSGGPEHRFFDEIHPDLKHTGPGILSMANSGPATNGSQFFITHVATPWLNGKHTVFGHVVEGQDVVNAIVQDDVMTKVTIIREGKAAKNWNATKVYADTYAKMKVAEDARIAEQVRLDQEAKARYAVIDAMSVAEYNAYLLKEVQKIYPNAQQTATGLVYIIESKGTGPMAQRGNNVSVHYTGTFLADKEGKMPFDSSYKRNQPMAFKYLEQKMIGGFEEALTMIGQGGKGKFIIPYHSAYGKQARPGIPPYSDLVFDLEVVSVQP